MPRLVAVLILAAALAGCFAYGSSTNISSGVTCHSSFWGLPFATTTSTGCVDAQGNPIQPHPTPTPPP